MSASLSLHINARDLFFALGDQRLYDGALLEVWFAGAWHRGLFCWFELSAEPPCLVGWGGPPHAIELDTPCRGVPGLWTQLFTPAA